MSAWLQELVTILVTGANGLLGSSLCPYLQRNGYDVTRQGRTIDCGLRAELTDFDEVKLTLDQLQPDLIINLAAYTNVDECECYPSKAYLANTHIVENLSRWIKETGGVCHLLQLSTDQVYDGIGPHREDTVCLTNYYSFSKYAGELAATAVGATVLRTNFVGRSKCNRRQTLSDVFVEAFRRGTAIALVKNVLFSPLDIAHLCPMIERVIQRRQPGVYNLGCRNGLSKADFGACLAEELGLSIRNASRERIAELHLRAYRPRDMRMDSSLFERVFQTELPTVEQTIASVANSYRN